MFTHIDHNIDLPDRCLGLPGQYVGLPGRCHGLLVKPGTPEQLQSGTRNTGTLKILNLLRFEKKNTGGVELLLE